ncbi:MAG: metal-dependent transcriptional regulator [Lachnospiraceae bacterium]|nr:metal-dependent transcriptional regulator [Lachnospiraceae bacterium]
MNSEKSKKQESPARKIKAESREDYLKAIYVLSETNGRKIRPAELAKYMQFSNSSVSRALRILETEELLQIDENYLICLTGQGQEIARNIYDKHCFFRQKLLEAGVEEELASKEAGRMEHAISDESFKKLVAALL